MKSNHIKAWKMYSNGPGGTIFALPADRASREILLEQIAIAIHQAPDSEPGIECGYRTRLPAARAVLTALGFTYQGRTKKS